MRTGIIETAVNDDGRYAVEIGTRSLRRQSRGRWSPNEWATDLIGRQASGRISGLQFSIRLGLTVGLWVDVDAEYEITSADYTGMIVEDIVIPSAEIEALSEMVTLIARKAAEAGEVTNSIPVDPTAAAKHRLGVLRTAVAMAETEVAEVEAAAAAAAAASQLSDQPSVDEATAP